MNRLKSVLKIDARYLQIINNALLIVVGMTFFYLHRSPVQVATCLGVCVIAEISFSRYFGKYDTLLGRVLSGLSPALGLIVLVRFTHVWAIALASFAAIASKYLLRVGGNHVFNPSNFGVVLCALILPFSEFIFYPDQFGLFKIAIYQTLFFGIWAIVAVQRFYLVIFYFLFMFLGSLMIDHAGGYSFYEIVGPDLSAAGLLFILFMTTDPKTSPVKVHHQGLFALLLATMTFYLRTQGALGAGFIALFITCLLFGASRFWGLYIRSPSDAILR